MNTIDMPLGIGVVYASHWLSGVPGRRHALQFDLPPLLHQL
jgi:hypothetical protein